MVTLPPAAWRDDAGLTALIDVLGGGSFTRFVGGAVRDRLLDLPVSDVDLATRLTPDVVMTRLRAAGIKVVPTGLAHGTVTAVTGGGPVEVTTLRHDVSTDGRHATVAFADDWRADAARRDFTINALYADAATGEVFDWFGGLADIAARRVRFIGDPLVRIAEDHLRILRFFRFHARFGDGLPDAAGLAACIARANDLMALSRERIAAELLKLLGVAEPGPTVTAMIDGGIFRPVLPEIVDAARLLALTAYERLLGIAPDPLRRLAALLPADATVVAAVAVRLRLSNAHVRRLTLLGARPRGRPDELAYRHGVGGARDLLLLAGDDPCLLDGFVPPVLPVKGGDIVARGITVGPRVAATLKAIESEWVASGFPVGHAFDAIVARHAGRDTPQT